MLTNQINLLYLKKLLYNIQQSVRKDGMRDSISMLDKCISYSNNISVENVVKALGISDYESLDKLLEYILCDNDKGSIEIIESIYSQGKDLKLFIKNFIQYILDVCKYIMYNSYNYFQISNKIDLTYYKDFEYKRLLNILDNIIELNNQIKYEQNQKELIESKLLLLCRNGVEN